MKTYEYHGPDFIEIFDPEAVDEGTNRTFLTFYKNLIRKNHEGVIINDDGCVEFKLEE